MKEEILYTPEEVAKKLKLSKYTIYEMIKRGDIQAYHIGRSIRVSESQLESYIIGKGTVENVFEAEIVDTPEGTVALVKGIKIYVSTDLEGPAKISIRPEDIILSAGTFVSSARNMHKGKVVDFMYDEKKAKVVLNIGIPLVVLITKQSLDAMNIKRNDELYAIFKTMTVKVIK